MAELSFNFGEFVSNLDKQRQITEQRQQAELQKVDRDNAIRQQSVELAQGYDRQVNPLRKQIQQTIQKKNHERQLSGSGNPLDTLRLMGLRLMDPGGYDRDERQARLQEDMTIASAIGQTHNVAQGALEVELMATGAEVSKLKAQETIGLQKLTRYAEEAGMLTQNLTAARLQKESILETIPTDQLRAAELAAQGNGGKVNIQGMDIDGESIKNRIHANEEIRLERLNRQAIRERMEFVDLDPTLRKKQLENEKKAKKDEIDSFDQQLAITQAKRKTDFDAAQNVEHDLAWKQRQRKIEESQMTPEATDGVIMRMNEEAKMANEELLRRSQKKQLQMMSDKEIVRIQKNNFRDQHGEAFHPADLQQAFAEKQEALSNDLLMGQRESNLRNFGMNTLANENARVEQALRHIPPNSPAYTGALKHRENLALAVKYAESNDEAMKAQAMQITEESRQVFDQMLQKQASAEARGDKDLEQVKLAYYRGQPIPEAELRNTIKARLLKGQSFADVLPSQAVVEVSREFQKIENRMLEEASADLGLGQKLDTEGRKQIKQNAADAAIDSGVVKILKAEARTDQLLANQVGDPTNPLTQLGWKPADVTVTLGLADDSAKKRWIQEMQLTPEEVQLYNDGVPIPGKPGKLLKEALNKLENEELIMNLNARSPGLGQEYAQWWQNQGPAYIEKMEASRQANAGSGFNDVAMSTIAKNHVTQSMLDYGLAVAIANPAVIEQHAKRRAEFLTFDGNVEHSQAMLLHFAEHLEDSEKAMFFSQVIQPVIKQSKQRGLSYEETNRAVERAVEDDELVGSNPELKRIARSLRRDRAANVQKINDMLQLGTMFDTRVGGDYNNSARQIVDRLGQMTGVTRPNLDPSAAGLGWYMKLQTPSAPVPQGAQSNWRGQSPIQNQSTWQR